MPIFKREEIVGNLKPGTPNPFDRFVSELPTGEMMEGAAVSADYERAVENMPLDQYRNFGRSSKSATSRMAETVGVASYALKATPGNPLGKLGDLVGVDLEGFTNVDNPKAAMWKLVRQAGMEVFDELLNDVATKVPIAGAIVKVGLFLVDIFKLAFEEAQRTTRPPSVKAVAYDRDTDEDRTQDRLEWLTSVGRGDLTKLFLPYTEPEVVTEKRMYIDRGAWGVTAQVAGAKKLSGWQHIPGTAMVGDFWQYPTPYSEGEDKGYLMVGRGGMASGYAGLHPSVSQLSLLFWDMVRRNGPDAFRIDGDRIGATWAEYFRVLLGWVCGVGASDKPEAQHRFAKMAGLVSWAQMSVRQTYFDTSQKSLVEGYWPERVSPGGNLPAPPEGCPGGKVKCVPEEYVEWRAPVYEGWPPPGFIASWGGLVRYIIDTEWRARLPNYLRTLTVAYVPPKAPALRMDSALADLHDEMRRLLPTRNAVRLVDVDLIPDGEYRGVIERAQRTAKDLKLPEPKPPPLKVAIALDKVQPVDPNALAPMPAEPGAPAIPGEPTGVGWGWKLAAAAVAAAALKGLARR